MFESRNSVIASASLAALLLAATPASAQNLLTNPHFDTDLTGWTGLATFDGTRDANGSPSSGSASVAVTTPTFLVLLRQCIPAAQNTSYDFGGQAFIQQAPAGGAVGVSLAFTSDSTCTSSLGSAGTGSPVSAVGAWGSSTGTAVSPPGTAGALLLVGFSGTGNFVVNFDETFVQLTSAVPAMPPSMLAALALSLAFLAHRALRRRQLSA